LGKELNHETPKYKSGVLAFTEYVKTLTTFNIRELHTHKVYIRISVILK